MSTTWTILAADVEVAKSNIDYVITNPGATCYGQSNDMVSESREMSVFSLNQPSDNNGDTSKETELNDVITTQPRPHTWCAMPTESEGMTTYW